MHTEKSMLYQIQAYHHLICHFGNYARTMALLLIAIISTGCELGYYSHLIKGQTHMVTQREPIQALLDEPTLDPQLRNRLELTQAVLIFAEQEMQLEINGQYLDYIALDRRYAVWSLSAAPSLSFKPYQWCYPIIGCANYRGYFDRERAKADEFKLKEEGYETYIRGVSAYSTLGWFSDPVLSSFTHYSEDDYIELILHELAHSKLYIKNDTTFNESFATFVGQEGLKAFKASNLKTGTNIENKIKPHQDFSALKSLVLKYKDELAKIYQSERSQKEKLHFKEQVMGRLKQEYLQAKRQWSNPTAYDQWIESMNNAKMMVFSDYETKVPFFKSLFISCGERWECFYEKSKDASKL